MCGAAAITSASGRGSTVMRKNSLVPHSGYSSGAPGASAANGSTTTGSGSSSTTISSSASSAIARLVATTAAIGSPTNRTRSRASTPHSSGCTPGSGSRCVIGRGAGRVEIGLGDDRDHSRQRRRRARRRCRRISRVRARAAQDRDVAQTGDVVIGEIAAPAARQPRVLPALDARADHGTVSADAGPRPNFDAPRPRCPRSRCNGTGFPRARSRTSASLGCGRLLQQRDRGEHHRRACRTRTAAP